MNERVYLAIDLKSFFASVECVERGLDPLKTHLVVADASRTEKTICLAVSPSMKAYGIPGRPRLFEVVQKVREINLQRRAPRSPSNASTGASFLAEELEKSPELRMDYIIARPRMARYMAVQYPGLSNLPEICGSRGHSRLFHRRGVHGGHPLSENLPLDRPGAGHADDPGRAEVRPASPPRRGSARICICARSPWTSGLSGSRRMRTAFALRS